MKKLVLATLFTLLGANAQAFNNGNLPPENPSNIKTVEETYPNMIDRIRPVGTVCEVGGSCSVSAEQPASATGAAASGEVTFQNVCSQCHKAGLLGAPVFGNKAMWAPRIAQGKSTLYQHAINGYKNMPPKGGASQLTDAEVEGGVDYMVKNSS